MANQNESKTTVMPVTETAVTTTVKEVSPVATISYVANNGEHTVELLITDADGNNENVTVLPRAKVKLPAGYSLNISPAEKQTRKLVTFDLPV